MKTSGCKLCPLTREACREDCAWQYEKGCAVFHIADKLTDVENVVNSLDDILDAASGVEKQLFSIATDMSRK